MNLPGLAHRRKSAQVQGYFILCYDAMDENNVCNAGYMKSKCLAYICSGRPSLQVGKQSCISSSTRIQSEVRTALGGYLMPKYQSVLLDDGSRDRSHCLHNAKGN